MVALGAQKEFILKKWLSKVVQYFAFSTQYWLTLILDLFFCTYC